MALDQDEFYRNLTPEYKLQLMDDIAAKNFSPKFLGGTNGVWHGEIKHCPTCNDIRITSCCACGCGSCYTCSHRFSCLPVFFTPAPLGSIKNIDNHEWAKILRPAVEMDQVLDGLGLIPAIGSTWTHTNGNIYKVIAITNKDTAHPDKYPITVVYTGENGKTWSRPLSDWGRSMTERTQSNE